MKITIGVRDVPRELTLDIDMTEEAFRKETEAALASGTPLSLTDVGGDKVIVAAQAIGYVQIGAPKQHRVGFAVH